MGGRVVLDGKEWICSDHVVIGNDLYFVAGIDLIKVNMMSWEAHYITDVKNRDWIKEHGVGFIIAIDKTIFLISWSSLSIAMYDVDTHIIQPIYEEKDDTTNIFNIEVWNKYIYLFLRKKDEIIVIDKEGIITKYPFVLKEDKMVMSSCRVKDEIWFVPKEGKKYYRFSLEKKSFLTDELPFELKKCIDISIYNDQVFILDGNNIKVWNEEDVYNNVKIKDMVIDEIMFGMLIPLKNKIYILPKMGDDILEVSYDGLLRKYQEYPEGYAYTQPNSWLDIGAKYFSYESKDGIYYFPRRATNYMLSIDSQTENINWIAIKEPGNKESMIYKLESQGIVKERHGYLSVFLDGILTNSMMREGKENINR